MPGKMNWAEYYGEKKDFVCRALARGSSAEAKAEAADTREESPGSEEQRSG